MSDIIGKQAKPTPVEKPEIGIDLTNEFIDTVIDSIQSNALNLDTFSKFSTQAQTREQMYKLIDSMAMDDRVSSILETYAEDITETNEVGQIVWCESSNSDVSKYITFLLDSLNINKNIYEWTYSLLKYGDVYLKLYRQSDYGEDVLWGNDDGEKKNKKLNEDIYLNVSDKNDKFVHYVKMVPNPGEMFDLTRFGKTRGFIKAPVNIQTVFDNSNVFNNYFTYKMKKNDVDIYGPVDFVHACLTNSNTTRFPEEVSVFLNEKDYEAGTSGSNYEVKRGQSLLYNQFKIWRELSLLENSVMLNRVVTSALVRILSVEVGNMPKDKVSAYITRLKSNIEQKSAVSENTSMSEYTNPGPIVNTIYVPTHDGIGNVTAQSIGGDFDPKQLTDLDYFLNKFYGGFRVPKQFFGNTDDGAGFNGGSSLTILSSRYGKAIKKYQNIICQLITDLVNIFLIDRGLDTYVNAFTIRMQAPITQEELDRRENLRNRMGVVNDIMSQINQVIDDDDKLLKIKVLKSLLSTTLTDPEVIDLLQEKVEELENEVNSEEEEKKDTEKEDRDEDIIPFSSPESEPMEDESSEEELPEMPETPEVEEETPTEEPETEESDSYLPTADELGVSLLDND